MRDANAGAGIGFGCGLDALRFLGGKCAAGWAGFEVVPAVGENGEWWKLFLVRGYAGGLNYFLTVSECSDECGGILHLHLEGIGWSMAGSQLQDAVPNGSH